MKITNAILICFLSIAVNSLFAALPNHIQPFPLTEVVDTHALDVRVSDIGNCSNLLEWFLPAGQKCYSFVIMKSSDKINYTSIGSVLGKGSSEKHLYEFVDNHARSNTYYRVDLFDFNGGMISSEILTATTTCGDDKAATVIEEIYPNPLLDNELAIRVYQNRAATETVQLTDQFGKIIREKKISLVQGKNILQLNIRNIQHGIYFIKVGSASEKFKK